MTAIRWIALLPDPVIGLDEPVRGDDGKRLEWVAPDKAAATALAQKDLGLGQFRLASIVSLAEFETLPGRAKQLRSREWIAPRFRVHRDRGPQPG